MRLALIANPRSRTAPDPAELEALLAADGADVSCVALEEVADRDCGELEDGALDALTAAGAPDRLVVAGGDGSIGAAALCSAELRVPLAVVATGTANDFARAKDLPLDVEEACALARAPAAATIRAELGLAGRRPFVNAAAAGLSVIAARIAKQHKPRLGPLAYATGAVRAGLTASPLRCAVTCDEQPCFVGRAWQVIVGVTGAFGGGSEMGGTREDDAQLDVAVVPAGSRLGLVRRAFAMRRGRLTWQDDVPHARAAVVEVEIAGHPAFNVDGETCRCEPARFSLRKGGFEVVGPS